MFNPSFIIKVHSHEHSGLFGLIGSLLRTRYACLHCLISPLCPCCAAFQSTQKKVRISWLKFQMCVKGARHQKLAKTWLTLTKCVRVHRSELSAVRPSFEMRYQTAYILFYCTFIPWNVSKYSINSPKTNTAVYEYAPRALQLLSNSICQVSSVRTDIFKLWAVLNAALVLSLAALRKIYTLIFFVVSFKRSPMCQNFKFPLGMKGNT